MAWYGLRTMQIASRHTWPWYTEARGVVERGHHTQSHPCVCVCARQGRIGLTDPEAAKNVIVLVFAASNSIDWARAELKDVFKGAKRTCPLVTMPLASSKAPSVRHLCATVFQRQAYATCVVQYCSAKRAPSECCSIVALLPSSLLFIQGGLMPQLSSSKARGTVDFWNRCVQVGDGGGEYWGFRFPTYFSIHIW